MPNDEQFQENYTEIGPLAQDLRLWMKASFWEDENSTVPAPSIVTAVEKYYVKIEWELQGHLKRHFCGVWLLKIDLESIGVAGEYTSECRKIEMDPCREVPYETIFEVTTEALRPHECGTVYFVAATLSSLDPCGGRGHIWGYSKGPSVMFAP